MSLSDDPRRNYLQDAFRASQMPHASAAVVFWKQNIATRSIQAAMRFFAPPLKVLELRLVNLTFADIDSQHECS
jgi:hypothetical protein